MGRTGDKEEESRKGMVRLLKDEREFGGGRKRVTKCLFRTLFQSMGECGRKHCSFSFPRTCGFPLLVVLAGATMP